MGGRNMTRSLPAGGAGDDDSKNRGDASGSGQLLPHVHVAAAAAAVYTSGDGRALQERGARRKIASRIPLGAGRDRKQRATGVESGHNQNVYDAVPDASASTAQREEWPAAATRQQGIFEASTRVRRCAGSAMVEAPVCRATTRPTELRQLEDGGGEEQRFRRVALDNDESGQGWSKGEEHPREGSELRMAAADGSCDGTSEEGGARDAAACCERYMARCTCTCVMHGGVGCSSTVFEC